MNEPNIDNIDFVVTDTKTLKGRLSGKMNNKSGDDTYNKLIGDLRLSLKDLAEKIQPKVYEYGFLLE